MIKKALITVSLVALLVSIFAVYAFAGTGYSSSATIGKDDTGAYGGAWEPMYGATIFTGTNTSAATNTLYVGTYRRYASGTNVSYALIPGTLSFSKSATLNTCDYQVVLDPSGPNWSGCIGNGKMQN